MATKYKYDKNTDYAALMEQAAQRGDHASAAIYEQQRNAKIRGEGMTDQEQRVAAVLSAIEGVGQVRVVVYADEVSDSFGKTSAQPRGAVVVAQGADDLAVRLRLTTAARALLQLPANAIEIFPMEAP